MPGQTQDGLVAYCWTVVEIDNLKIIQILCNESNAFLTGCAPLNLKSFEFSQSHGNKR